MKILVTGAAGFLGRAVVESLLAHGALDLRCFVRPGCDLSNLEDIRRRYPLAQLDYFAGNLTSPDDARHAVEGVDTVYHLAAGMRGLPASIFLNTVVASKRLLDALPNKRCRVVLVSSIGVYGTSDLSAERVIGEDTELDPHPERRGIYFHAKIWQERLFRERAAKGEIELVTVRPGVLYGTGNPNRGFPSRIGIAIGGLLLVFANGRPLPLSHVANCAEAIVLAGQTKEASGQCYNVFDDDAPTAREYLRLYRCDVTKITAVRVPFPLAMLLSYAVQTYHVKTRGQIPAVLTPYETSALWKGHRFDNRRIKKLGWKQVVGSSLGLSEAFADLRAGLGRPHPTPGTNPVQAIGLRFDNVAPK